MNADDLFPLLTKSLASPDVQKALAAFGAKAARPKMGDLDARITLKSKGIDFVFDVFGAKKSKTKTYVLRDVQLYPGGRHGFKAFPGTLPKSLTFADSLSAARKKLGKPTLADDDMGIDHWAMKKFELIVSYAADCESISLVHIAVPFED